jgi:hypothetical protein
MECDRGCRFEFLEMLVRVALGRYITTGILTDTSDSVAKLMDECLAARAPAEAVYNPDTFRESRWGRWGCARPAVSYVQGWYTLTLHKHWGAMWGRWYCVHPVEVYWGLWSIDTT